MKSQNKTMFCTYSWPRISWLPVHSSFPQSYFLSFDLERLKNNKQVRLGSGVRNSRFSFKLPSHNQQVTFKHFKNTVHLIKLSIVLFRVKNLLWHYTWFSNKAQSYFHIYSEHTNTEGCSHLRDLEKEREGLWFLSRESDLSLLLSLERDLVQITTPHHQSKASIRPRRLPEEPPFRNEGFKLFNQGKPVSHAAINPFLREE